MGKTQKLFHLVKGPSFQNHPVFCLWKKVEKIFLDHFLLNLGDFLISDNFEGLKPSKSAKTKIFFAILLFFYYFPPLISKNSILFILNDFSSCRPLFIMFFEKWNYIFPALVPKKPIKNRGKIIHISSLFWIINRLGGGTASRAGPLGLKMYYENKKYRMLPRCAKVTYGIKFIAHYIILIRRI